MMREAHPLLEKPAVSTPIEARSLEECECVKIDESPRQSRRALAGKESSISGATWMSHIKNKTLLSALTIPGTHDSAAFTYSWAPFVATQTLDIQKQLDAGIRFFDLRCGIRDDILEMVHGTAVLGLRLDAVLDTMYSWLASHPTEAIIAQIKRDRKEENATMHFSQAIVKTVAARPESWRTANTTPTMGEMRGKIQLFRRFEGPSLFAYGLDVTRWQDNPSRPFTIYTWHGVQITIQDHYSFPDAEPLPSLIRKKGGDVAELLDRAVCDPCKDHWYINFTSGFEFNLYYQITPRQVAVGGWHAFRWEEGMNIRLREYLARHHGRRRYGVIAMDFFEAGTPDLVMAVIATNLQKKSTSRDVLLCVALLVLLIMLAVCWAENKTATRHWCPPLLHVCDLLGNHNTTYTP